MSSSLSLQPCTIDQLPCQRCVLAAASSSPPRSGRRRGTGPADRGRVGAGRTRRVGGRRERSHISRRRHGGSFGKGGERGDLTGVGEVGLGPHLFGGGRCGLPRKTEGLSLSELKPHMESFAAIRPCSALLSENINNS
jgi:hypothetical protein